MQTLTIKLDPELAQALVQASAQEHLSKSELVRRALAGYLLQRDTGTGTPSALEKAGDLVGCFADSPVDLSSNPRHLDDFGRT